MKKTKTIAFLAVFSALIAAVSFLPIRTFGWEITLSMVPVAVGAIAFGPTGGAVLGGVFGLVSFLQAFGWSPFGAALMGIHPLYTAVMCIPTRLLAGWLTGWIFRAFSHSEKAKRIGYPVASLSAALLNTVLFMTAFLTLFYQTDYVQSFVAQTGATNPFTFAAVFVGINGLVEMAAAFVLATPSAIAVCRVLRRGK